MVDFEKIEKDDHFIPDGMNGFERNTKRVIDCLTALVAMIVFSPLFLFCYIAVKREDGGPAIFKQERIGRFGRPFYIYKFRSMKLDAEKAGPALYSGGKDKRMTKIGKFLREHHLDELPQLWNVFCGQMAFIGPRPERKFYIDQIMERDPRYRYLYQIRPGSPPTPPSTTAIPIPSRRCSAACATTSSIWSTVPGASTSKFFG